MSEPESVAALVGRVPELSGGKLTGPSWTDAEPMLAAILAAGAKGLAEVIDMLADPDDGRDYKARYVLGALAVHVCRPAGAAGRAAVVEALASGLGGDRPKPIRGFLVRLLQTVGDKRAVPALAELLADEELGPDAVAALEAIGADAAELLRKALPEASPSNRRAVLQSLGRLKDAASAPTMRQAAGDDDPESRIVALRALADIADAQAVDLAIRASAAEGWEGIQAADACLTLAENLLAAGRKPEAARVCEHLCKTRTETGQAHVRDAASAILARCN